MGSDHPDPLAALIADARHGDGPVAVPLGDHLFRVRPAWEWPWPAVTSLLNGHYHRWATAALADDGHHQWAHLDPTNRQARRFLHDWGLRGGDDITAIARLAPILTEHARTIEGDLALVGYDVRDLWRPGGGPKRLTWRHLAAIWDALPGECLTKTALRDALDDEALTAIAGQKRDGHGPWSFVALRIASLEDAVRVLTWRFMQVNFKDGNNIPAPDPVPRPGVTAKRGRKLNAAGLAYLQHLRANRGAAPAGTKSLGAVRG